MENEVAPRSRRLRAFTSLLLMLSFVAMVLSGTVLFVAPGSSGWSLLGMDREVWESIHINNAALLLVVAVGHVLLNWSIFWSYLKKRTAGGRLFKWEMGLALVILIVVLAGAVLKAPPFDNLFELHEDLESVEGPS